MWNVSNRDCAETAGVFILESHQICIFLYASHISSEWLVFVIDIITS
ncbi:hypothetical protein VCHA34P112_10126 [Vibrio chagasii]|nr:hypothetical protein VCHA34P112_10126 [Vibrio chagasii]CAH7066370.1 hypothetical protein VCHA56P515_10252 [Vibrio chagasii]CAH7119270.1 hypothetical protein VCHA53O463_10252 [Vibrio chagasii]